jgi:hypothetical protein
MGPVYLSIRAAGWVQHLIARGTGRESHVHEERRFGYRCPRSERVRRRRRALGLPSSTQIYGLSRRSAPLPAGVEGISADLLDRDDLQ